jgi:hypothetical protein
MRQIFVRHSVFLLAVKKLKWGNLRNVSKIEPAWKVSNLGVPVNPSTVLEKLHHRHARCLASVAESLGDSGR